MSSIITPTAALLAALALCVAPLQATDHFVGGPSGFATIAEAIAAAAPGDRIFVAPGIYTGFDLNKAVEIRGAGINQTRIGNSFDPKRTTVSGIPAGGVVVLSSMSFNPAWFLTVDSGPQVTIQQNAGTVVLNDIGVNNSPLAWHFGPGIRVTNTQRCLIQKATVLGINQVGFPTDGTEGIIASGSYLDLTDCVVVASATQTGSTFFPGAAGLLLSQCEARLARVQITGGAGGGPGGAGITLLGSHLTLAGGPSNLIKGGTSQVGGPGLRLEQSSSATIASDALLQAGVGLSTPGQAISAEVGSSVTQLPNNLQSLVPVAAEVQIGGAYGLSHAGPALALVIPVLSAGLGPAFSLPGYEGLVHIDLAQPTLLPVVQHNALGLATSNGSVPNASGLLGASFWFQSVSIDGAALRISNPARIEITL
jgi:hypothetical protein